MIIIGSVVLAVIIAAVIVICILVSNANNPVNKMINAINNGEYKTANELYYNNYNALSDNKAVIDAIQAQVDAVKKLMTMVLWTMILQWISLMIFLIYRCLMKHHLAK